MKLLAILIFCCVFTRAQQSSPPPVTTPPAASCPTYIDVGATYDPSASPKTTGYAAIGTLFPGLKCSGSGLQPYSFSQYAVTSATVNGVRTLETTTTTGLAVPFKSITIGTLPLTIFGIGNIGAAVAGSTSTVKLGTTYGGILPIPLGKTSGWFIVPGVQWINGQRTVILGFMGSWK